MKISLNWIKEYIDHDFDISELSHELTMAGLEVEGVSEIKPLFNNIVASKILSINPHPNANNLQICVVNDGKENFQIVCGAKNIFPNAIVPLASIGSNLPNMAIQHVRIRDVDSFGMLCSEKELQIGFDQSGVMILPDSTYVGTPLEKVFNLNDTVIELGITPNRGDCLSIRGVAREIAASFGKKIKYRKFPNYHSHHTDFSVHIDDSDLCPIYGGALISKLKIKQSPFELRYKLYLLGLRAINNIVDITNFILMDIGQPMHSFDAFKIHNKNIKVRLAKDHEDIKTLDGEVRKLTPNNLVIADANKPIAVAGVMGGELSSVTEATTDIFFESAYFNPKTVRKTSRQLSLISDSSYRFERGIDPESIPTSLLMACKMAEEYAEATIINPRINLDKINFAKKTIILRPKRCSQILGLKLKENQIVNTLKKIEIKKSKKDEYIIPGYRNDIENEIDLIEEVARVTGYENIYEHVEKIDVKVSQNDKLYTLRKHITDNLVTLGLHQVINYSFVAETDLISIDNFINKPVKPEKIKNPISPDQSVMRNSLLPGLIKNFVTSKNYRINDIKLFETGAVFPGNSNQIDHLGIVLGGGVTPLNVCDKIRNFDFFDMKGIILELFNLLHINIKISKHTSDFFGDGFVIHNDSKLLGVFGEISENILKKYDSKEKIYCAEFDIKLILNSQTQKKKYIPFSRMPEVTLDMSFVINNEVSHEDIELVMKESGISIIEKIKIFDIYKGKNVPDDKKSLAYSITYRDNEKTLELETVNRFHDNIKNCLRDKLGADFR